MAHLCPVCPFYTGAYQLQHPWDDLFAALLLLNTFAQVILITAIEGLRVEDKNEQFKRKVGWTETDSSGSEVSVISVTSTSKYN